MPLLQNPGRPCYMLKLSVNPFRIGLPSSLLRYELLQMQMIFMMAQGRVHFSSIFELGLEQ